MIVHMTNAQFETATVNRLRELGFNGECSIKVERDYVSWAVRPKYAQNSAVVGLYMKKPITVEGVAKAAFNAAVAQG